MSDLLQGLSISLLGMLITFLFFGLLILLVVVLRGIFQVPPIEKGAMHVEPEHSDPPKPAQDLNRMKAAGIAVVAAALKAKVQQESDLGQLLEDPPGRWWRASHED